MDLSGSGSRSQQDQPSPATISTQSRGGSTSHSSYSPGTNEHSLPYRSSPNPNSKPLPLQPTNSFPPLQNFDPSSGGLDMFSTAFSTNGVAGDEAFNQGFLVGSDWDYTQGTGVTPMSDGVWNQMLESVTMGWSEHGGQEQGQGQ
jgi:hypothetical protein